MAVTPPSRKRQRRHICLGRMTGSRREAFTILEVLLTLSMAVVLMSLVGAAMQFYARSMNVRDMDVRRVQMAAAVMQMISDDLRAAVHPPEFDASALEAMLSGSGGDAIAGLDPEAATALGLGDGLMTDDLSPPDSLDLQGLTMTLRRPGMIGSQTEVQFDVSRLPRLEQWQQMLGEDPGEMTDVPSDLKTVTYYVQPPGAAGGVTDSLLEFLPPEALADSGIAAGAALGGGMAPGGLVRRELDRAATKYAIDFGGIVGLHSSGELLAAEVLAIEFSYFDGVQWQLFWNSDEMQTLPQAIQVQLTVGDAVRSEAQADTVVTAPRVFTQIIHLPAGRMVPMDMMMGGAF